MPAMSPPRNTPDPSERHRLTAISGLAALSLDAMASVAYGPEAIVLALAAAGGAGLGLTLPVTLTIAALLAVLVCSYRQVIAAFPEGGGSYGVAREHLGRRSSLVAAASLIVDYVLDVAVSVAAGVAALTSAFPGLLPYTVWLCLAVLVLVTAVDYRGIAGSARVFIVPWLVFVGAIGVVVVAGLLRHGAAPAPAAGGQAQTLQTVGVLLLLKAFANGCAALTGVEAIANAVPSFREARVKRAQRAEVGLGALLALMLLGIAVLIEKFSIRPVTGVTVLSQVTEVAVGHGAGFYLVQFSTVVLLALAANTSFGGLPVLAQLLARHHNLPHLFVLRDERQVHRYGIGFLALVAGALLIIVKGHMNALVPMFAIGVFIGFTLSQAGMVRHWLAARSSGWHWRAVLNGFGALLTGVAAVVVTVSKFTAGGWIIVLAVPALVATMEWVNRRYRDIGERLELGRTPGPPRPRRSLVVVPVSAVDRLTREALAAALSLSDRVVAVHVTYPDEVAERRRFEEEWERWNPGVELVLLHGPSRRLTAPLVTYLRRLREACVFVLIPEVEPGRFWERILQNQRGQVLARALRRHTDVVVCRLRFRIGPLPLRRPATVPGPAGHGPRPLPRSTTARHAS
jgi:amino acid transporter